MEKRDLVLEALQTHKDMLKFAVKLAQGIRRRFEQSVHIRYQCLDGEREAWQTELFQLASLENATIGRTIIQDEIDHGVAHTISNVRELLGDMPELAVLEEYIRGQLLFRETLTPEDKHLVEYLDEKMGWVPFHEPEIVADESEPLGRRSGMSDVHSLSAWKTFDHRPISEES